MNNIDRTTKPDNSISEYDIVRGHYDHLRGDAEDLAAGHEDTQVRIFLCITENFHLKSQPRLQLC